MEADTTSLFRTTEEYFIRQEEFWQYINEQVNPARLADGLSEIKYQHAKECFRIMDKFFVQWRLGSPASGEVDG
jgi:hypothetical protein